MRPGAGDLRRHDPRGAGRDDADEGQPGQGESGRQPAGAGMSSVRQAAARPALRVPFVGVLLILALLVNALLQRDFVDPGTLNSNMRVFLPLILVTVGEAVVILGGGIDI